MLGRRIAYAIILLASIAALVITNSGIALFLLVCVASLPFVSLILLLCAVKRVKFDCEARGSCVRGGALQITMKVGLSPAWLIGSVHIIADIDNTTFRKTERKKFMFKDLSFAPHTYDYVSADSGRICVHFRKIRLIGLFGIFAIGVKCSRYTESSVSPILYDEMQITLGSKKIDYMFGDNALPQKGSDVSEIFNIRDYTAGDALNSVHWKLSGKFDSLKSKEYGSTDDNRLLILVDMSRNYNDVAASDDQLNAVLDVAISISDSLRADGYSHSVGWFDDGEFSRTEVTDSNSFVDMVSRLMSIKVNEGDNDELFCLSRLQNRAAFTKVVYVSAAMRTEELRDYVNSDITAISIGEEIGEMNMNGIKIINVPCERIRSALTACVL